tara:strand:+ start:246 stop:461 length:216 start_codon:yes stop_codon:yes gene_type:complete
MKEMNILELNSIGRAVIRFGRKNQSLKGDSLAMNLAKDKEGYLEIIQNRYQRFLRLLFLHNSLLFWFGHCS